MRSLTRPAAPESAAPTPAPEFSVHAAHKSAAPSPAPKSSTLAPAALKRAAERVAPALAAWLPADAEPRILYEAMRHSVFPGGKRLRPALAFAAAEAAGRDETCALPAALAVELLHSYSLVHDDLPCMDDDAERRGLPSVHAKYGEAVAVLAGDALQALAFEVLAHCEAEGAQQQAARLPALCELAAAAGARGLVGGQCDDLHFKTGGKDEAMRMESVHRRKSAALVAASVTLGARLAGAAPELLQPLAGFGEEIGIAFQVADDLLDREREGEACSLVRVLGADAARTRAEALLESALARLSALGPDADTLRALGVYAVRRET